MQRVLTSRYVWRGIKKDVRNWCCERPDCQASKITRHVHSPKEHPSPPTVRFADINVDLVGPLPKSIDSMSYMLTAIDIYKVAGSVSYTRYQS